MATDQECVIKTIDNALIEEFRIVHARWLDQHHFQFDRIKECLETVSLMQVRQHLNVIVHDMVVLHAVLPLFVPSLSILVDHTQELLLFL